MATTQQSSLLDDETSNDGGNMNDTDHHVSHQQVQDEEQTTSANADSIDPTVSVLPSILPTLIISVILGLVSGTLYGFGRYAKTLKEILGLSQSQVQTLGICMDCGNYVGHPLTGLIYDRKGPIVSCFLGGIIVFLSYWRIRWTLLNHHDPEEDLSTAASIWLDLAFCGVGFGSGLGYIAGLGSTTKALSLPSTMQYFGTGIGMVAAGYGMSSTLVGLTYQLLPDLPSFFRFWALIVPAANLCAAFMFGIQAGAINSVPSDAETDSSPGQQLTDPVVEPLLSSTNLVEENLEEADLPPVRESSVVREGGEDIPQEESMTVVSRNNIKTGWNSWKTPEFWLLFASFSCATGCGLMVINNLSTMVESMDGTDSYAGTLILVLSISNVSGRILVGIFGDSSSWATFLPTSVVLRRIRLLQGVNLIMASAMFMGYLRGQRTVCLTLLVIMVALAYGGSWVLIVALASNLFGKDHFGKDYGLLALGPALSGMIFNKASATWYEQHTSSSTNICMGRKCYENSYLAAGLVALVGNLITIILYKMQQRKEHSR